MVRASHLVQWRPAGIIDAALDLAAAAFIRHLRASFVLLVKVDNFSSPVAEGLAAISEFPPAPGSPAPGTRTREANTLLIMARIEEARKLRGVRKGVPTASMLEPRWIVPIRRRGTSEGAEVTYISVGRGRAHDIVLRDRSVSKLHAQFSQEAQELALRDMESKNCTLLNGVVTTDDFVSVKHGDEVRFGEVEALICSATHFWEAARGR